MNLVKAAIREFNNDHCATTAGALAYFTVFSLPAVLMLASFVAGALFGRQSAVHEIEKQLGSTMSPQINTQLQVLLHSFADGRDRGLIGTLIAAIAILFAATKAFAELQRVLNRAFEVQYVHNGLRGFAWKRVTAFFMIIGITVLLLASMTAGAVVMMVNRALASSVPLTYVWDIVAPLTVLTLLVAAVFKILPDARLAWRDVWFGAMVTGALLVAGKYLLSLYISRTLIGSVYGAAGSFALLLLWLYFSSAVLLFGAELTQVRARQHGRAAMPTAEAVPIDKKDIPAA